MTLWAVLYSGTKTTKKKDDSSKMLKDGKYEKKPNT